MKLVRNRMTVIKLVCFLMLLLWYVIPLYSDVELDNPEHHNDVALLPYVSYASETGLTGGLLASLNLYDLFFKEDHFILLTSAQYTAKKQTALDLKQDYLSGPGGLYTEIDFGYKYWPDDFSGVGITSSESSKENYTSKEFEVEWLIGKHNIYRGWSVGLLADFADYSVKIGPESPLLSSGMIIGSSGGRLAGAGFQISRDRRNSIFFATDGDFIELSSAIYHQKICGDFTFNRFILDLRRYIALTEKQSLSFQFLTGYQTVSAPFQKMFQLGDYLRAFPSSRYIDNAIMITRSEYRIFPWDHGVLRRIGFVLFAETGNLADRFGNWEITNQKFSFGGGGRYRLIEGEGMLLRFDIGFSSESVNILFVAREAF